jgi:hypothetical protein
MISKTKPVTAETEWDLAFHSDFNTYSIRQWYRRWCHDEPQTGANNHGDSKLGILVKKNKDHSLTGESTYIKKTRPLPLSTKIALLSIIVLMAHIQLLAERQACSTHTTYTEGMEDHLHLLPFLEWQWLECFFAVTLKVGYGIRDWIAGIHFSTSGHAILWLHHKMQHIYHNSYTSNSKNITWLIQTMTDHGRWAYYMNFFFTYCMMFAKSYNSCDHLAWTKWLIFSHYTCLSIHILALN